jgi:parallel beta-helix repeat protein
MRWPVRALVLLLALCLLLPSVAHATTYYVSAGGHGESSVSDGNSCGTAQNITTPKRNLTGSQGGLACLQGAGDILYIRGGTYNEVIHNSTYPSGSSWSNPTAGGSVVWIGAYQTGGVYENATIQGDNTDGTLEMWGANYVMWDHLHIHSTNSQSSAVQAGGVTQRFQNGEVTLSNVPACTVPYTFHNGILVIVREGSGNPSVPPGMAFTNNYIHDSPCSYSFYIQGWTDTLLIDGNIMTGDAGYAIQTYIHDCSDNGLPPGCFKNVIITNNIMAGSGYGINPDPPAPHPNHQCAMNLRECTNCLVANNLIYGNWCGLEISQGSNGIKVYNNTFYNNEDQVPAVIDVWEGTTNTDIRNNIGYVSGHTLVSGRDGQPPTGTYTQSSNLFATDPKFAGPSAVPPNLHLTGASPAIDIGTCVAAVPTDKDGNMRPAGGQCDIGAYEYGGVVTPPTPPLPAPTNLRLGWQP